MRLSGPASAAAAVERRWHAALWTCLRGRHRRARLAGLASIAAAVKRRSRASPRPRLCGRCRRAARQTGLRASVAAHRPDQPKIPKPPRKLQEPTGPAVGRGERAGHEDAAEPPGPHSERV